MGGSQQRERVKKLHRRKAGEGANSNERYYFQMHIQGEQRGVFMNINQGR